MRKMYKVILGTVAGVILTASGAMALPLMPSVPGDEPLYIKFNNYEQISPAVDLAGNPIGNPLGNIVAPSGAIEANWGIIDVSSIATGDLSTLPTGPLPNGQLYGRDNTNVVWADALGGVPTAGELTGIYYGVQNDVTNGTAVGSDVNAIAGTGGFLDIYFDPANDFTNVFNALSRTADDMYTGATEGTFLARIEFMNGAISFGNPLTSIVGSVVPNPLGFTTGTGDSFGSVVDVNGDGVIDSSDGLWAAFLNGNWFDTLLGPNTADFRFKFSYNPYATWNGVLDITGAISDDPARVYTTSGVPEPASMLLLGTGLAGLAGFSRRRKKSNI